MVVLESDISRVETSYPSCGMDRIEARLPTHSPLVIVCAAPPKKH